MDKLNGWMDGWNFPARPLARSISSSTTLNIGVTIFPGAAEVPKRDDLSKA